MKKILFFLVFFMMMIGHYDQAKADGNFYMQDEKSGTTYLLDLTSGPFGPGENGTAKLSLYNGAEIAEYSYHIDIDEPAIISLPAFNGFFRMDADKSEMELFLFTGIKFKPGIPND